MKVNQNVSIFAGSDDTAARRVNGNEKHPSGRQKTNTINGASLNGRFDPIERKRALAKKQAYKIVSDTFASENKIDRDMADRAARLKAYYKEYSSASRDLKEIDSQKDQLRQEYGVEKDSQEQKDLEILEKYNRNKRGNHLAEMSPEEKERARQLAAEGKDQGYTEYQKRALGLDAGKDPVMDRIDEAKKGIAIESGTIRATRLERLKYHAMLDAKQDADKILESASDEIVGMLIDEAKDHIDEKSEEEIEKADERKEEKKEELEKLEKAKERREEMEALADPEHAEEKESRHTRESDMLLGDPVTESLLRMDDIKNNVKQEVSDIMSKMKLVAEDVKGIKVDEIL